MSAFDNIPVGSSVVYKDECEVQVWHGGCMVSVLCAYSGAELDVWNFSEKPATLAEVVERAAERMNEVE